jgi:hypothetical protein
MKLSKTDYLIYKDCAKNAWLKVHKPDIYFSKPLSVFDQGIIEAGNEVDSLARDLFPGGILIEDRNDSEGTMNLIKAKTEVIYQPVFETKFYKAISDILVWNKDTKLYDLYEVKASNSGENKSANDKLYAQDIAFQYIVMKELEIPIGRLFLLRLNNEYSRGVELELDKLFSKEDFTEDVLEIVDNTKEDMKMAYEFITQTDEPPGSCKCIIRGRSSHCTTFSYSNPDVPDYSVHDISRIGQSKRKLAELVDSGIFKIEDVPDEFELSDKQKNQVEATKSGKTFISKDEIKTFVDTISHPISFLDYETFAAAIPRFPGYNPYNQIPFQFSLHVAHDEKKEPDHREFIFTENKYPDEEFIQAMKKHIPDSGSIVVWSKTFEMGRNKDLAKRNPPHKEFLENVNKRIVDLMDVFTNQHFIHPGFKGKTSIKNILPVLAPELSYKALDIKEGATASNTWDKIVKGELDKGEAIEKIESLKIYCKLDTYAMYVIWKYLRENT